MFNVHNLQTKKFETLLYLKSVFLKTIELGKVQTTKFKPKSTGKKIGPSRPNAQNLRPFKGKISFLMFKFSRAVCLKNIELEKVQNSNRKKKSVRLVSSKCAKFETFRINKDSIHVFQIYLSSL